MGYEGEGRNGMRLVSSNGGYTEENIQALADFALSAFSGENSAITKAGRPVAPAQVVSEEDIFAGVVRLRQAHKLISMQIAPGQTKPEIATEYIVPNRGNMQLSPVPELGPITLTPRRTGYLSLVENTSAKTVYDQNHGVKKRKR